ncbi:hypothetical protein AGRA3207_007252 [Actinomadura graeca]|uniref:Uncharacterized protein n=1 Tax=Actinomadura graeca TaxID=2750812 RepID=A0ABX8R4G7_9ACTN|nr:hypothetical protein [Actinomadura graeca]QXJ25723.1 hypothetical protein AGRA3207_007252 [Actinomadura graeca]
MRPASVLVALTLSTTLAGSLTAVTAAPADAAQGYVRVWTPGSGKGHRDYVNPVGCYTTGRQTVLGNNTDRRIEVYGNGGCQGNVYRYVQAGDLFEEWPFRSFYAPR